MKKTNYQTPCVEIVEVKIEKGFATSAGDNNGAVTETMDEIEFENDIWAN